MKWLRSFLAAQRERGNRAEIRELRCLIAQHEAEAGVIRQLLFDWKVPHDQTHRLIRELIDTEGCVAWNRAELAQLEAKS